MRSLMTVTVKCVDLIFVLNFALILPLEEHYITMSKINILISIYLSCISNSKSVSKSKQWIIYTIVQSMLSMLQSVLTALSYLQVFQNI